MEPQDQQHIEQPVPQKKTSISVPAAIITAGVLIAAGLVFSKSAPSTSKTIKNDVPTAPTSTVTVRSDDYVRGDILKAEVIIVEYSDSDCPYCGRFHTTMKEVLSAYGDKVAWIYRYFPLAMHANAHNEAYALSCAGELGGNEVFWKYLDQVIDITVTPEKALPILTSTATSLGITEKAFTSCLASETTKKKVSDQIEETKSLGAQGTPYSIAINKSGKQVAIPGAYPIEEMKKIIDGLMK
jgi:protein-disulfide isomerase